MLDSTAGSTGCRQQPAVVSCVENLAVERTAYMLGIVPFSPPELPELKAFGPLLPQAAHTHGDSASKRSTNVVCTFVRTCTFGLRCAKDSSTWMAGNSVLTLPCRTALADVIDGGYVLSSFAIVYAPGLLVLLQCATRAGQGTNGWLRRVWQTTQTTHKRVFSRCWPALGLRHSWCEYFMTK